MGVTSKEKRLGILLGGGPAPGINSVTSSATIEAINSGLQFLGIYDGFEHLAQGHTDAVPSLEIADVSRIHFQGGFILRISRANPTAQPEEQRRTVRALRELGITYLVSIGGDNTPFSAAAVAAAAEGAVRVAHVPKTIDNDLPLPDGMPTFDFETARHVGTETVLNLSEDSRTTNRRYFVATMGRKAGHLALGIGKAAGATITIIPEEFSQERVTLEQVCRVLEGAILKLRTMDRAYGLAVIAEGVVEKLDPQGLVGVPGVEIGYGSYGNLRLGELPLATLLKRGGQRAFMDRGQELSIVDVTLSYALRSAQSIPYHIDYTRTLGYGAVRFLLSETTDSRLRLGGLVCLAAGHLQALPFEELRDPATGRTRIQMVDVRFEHYIAARKYMIRLEPQDLEDPEMRPQLAQAAAMSPEQFSQAFSPVVAGGVASGDMG